MHCCRVTNHKGKRRGRTVDARCNKRAGWPGFGQRREVGQPDVCHSSHPALAGHGRMKALGPLSCRCDTSCRCYNNHGLSRHQGANIRLSWAVKKHRQCKMHGYLSSTLPTSTSANPTSYISMSSTAGRNKAACMNHPRGRGRAGSQQGAQCDNANNHERSPRVINQRAQHSRREQEERHSGQLRHHPPFAAVAPFAGVKKFLQERLPFCLQECRNSVCCNRQATYCISSQ